MYFLIREKPVEAVAMAMTAREIFKASQERARHEDLALVRDGHILADLRPGVWYPNGKVDRGLYPATLKVDPNTLAAACLRFETEHADDE